MGVTQDQMIKIRSLVYKETALAGRSVRRLIKQQRSDGPYLWVEYSSGTRKSIKFTTTDVRDATFAVFKEQNDVDNGEAG